MKRKRILVFLLSALMLLSLCGCGASAKNTAAGLRGDDYYLSEPAEAAMEAPAPMVDEVWYYENDAGGFAASETTYYAEEPEAKTPDIDPEKIIYSADATVETTDFDKSLAGLEALVQQFGGFVESSSINGSNYYSQSRGYTSSRSASYVIRIPSDRFQELMGSLSTLGNVPYSHTYSENITAGYYDVQARMKAYEAQEQRLMEMMELAETVSDLIEIESRLSDLRWQIDSLQATLNNWDRQVSYSSVSVSINEVTVYTPEATLTYGERLGLAIRNGLQSTADFFSSFLLWFLEALPALVILAVIVIVAVVLIRRSCKKRRARRIAAAQPVASETPGVVKSDK